MKKSLISCLFLSCFSSPLFAMNTVNLSIDAPRGWYLGGSGGVTFPIVTNNNYLATSAGWPADQYQYSEATSAAPFVAVQGGYTWATQRGWFPFYSLGGSYTYVLPTNISGQVLQYSEPDFTNYAFKYQVQRQTLLLTFKTDIYRWNTVMPYIAAGAGVSYNRASNYAETPYAGITPRVSPAFGSHAQTNLSYTLGIGLDFILKRNVLFSMEYNYGYFGNVQTGNNSTNQHLSTRLASNTFILSGNYFFDKTL